MRRLVTTVVLLVLTASPAAGQQPAVVGAGERIGGHDLAAWEVTWNRWVLGFPLAELETGTTCLPQTSTGPVWFLSGRGDARTQVSSVDCTVPASSFILLGVPEVECTDLVPAPGFATTNHGLRRCARSYWQKLADHHPRLFFDGQPLPHGPIVHTPVFHFTLAAEDNVFGLVATGGRAAVVARATMLQPLTPGVHTLIQGIRYRGLYNLLTVYNLTVV